MASFGPPEFMPNVPKLEQFGGSCKCGCGHPTRIARINRTARGWIKGQPMPFLPKHGGRKPLAERYWSKVDKNGPTPRPDLGQCWEWIGSKGVDGRAKLTIGPSDKSAAIISLFLHTGVWPSKWALHKCDNPACTRPDHLFEGTVVDNNRDRTEKGRSPRGSNHAHAKLTEEKVKALRDEAKGGISQRKLANKYDLNRKTVFSIVHNMTWRHV